MHELLWNWRFLHYPLCSLRSCSHLSVQRGFILHCHCPSAKRDKREPSVVCQVPRETDERGVRELSCLQEDKRLRSKEIKTQEQDKTTARVREHMSGVVAR